MDEIKDVMQDVMEAIKDYVNDDSVIIKSYSLPETLQDVQKFILIVPMNAPEMMSFGSNKNLAMQYSYQVNVESQDYEETKKLARAVREAMKSLSWSQLSGGLDEYFEETKRYVDARRYRGHSAFYDDAY